MSEDVLQSYRFRAEREAGWRQLEKLVVRVERDGLSSLSGEEQFQIPLLYRGCVSSLSVARSLSLDANLLRYLESLARRAYFVVYGSRARISSLILEFLVRDFPAAVRRIGWSAGLAGIILLLGVFTGWAATLVDSAWFEAFVSRGMAGPRTPEASYEDLSAILFNKDGSMGDYAAFSSALFTHNAQVAVLCVALGALLGVPVVMLMFYNGTLLGAMLAVHTAKGLGVEFTAWLLIHGVTELTAIILAGGCGFYLAGAVISPGRSSRLRALAERGRTAGILAVGVVAMLVIAGLLEGFGRQLINDTGTRFSVAGVTFALWYSYFVFAGRVRWDWQKTVHRLGAGRKPEGAS